MFIVEQFGKVWIIENGVRLEEPFLDVEDLLTQSEFEQDHTERGLLGLAFHPKYAVNGCFYNNYTDSNGDTVVARYKVSSHDPNIAAPSSAKTIIQIQQPGKFHNGGHLAFGGDGYLYIAVGDGKGGNDPLGAGQNTNVLLASILRINVDGALPYAVPPDNPFAGDDAGLDEIWVYGLRNPWRFSFDRLTDDMYIADVGEYTWEEVHFQPANSQGGENYGWPAYEGTHSRGDVTITNHVPPIAEYSHSQGCSIIGGYVYRGEEIPDLVAVYLFGDWCSGLIWATYRDIDMQWHTQVFMQTDLNISSFGEDEQGEIYIIDYGGTVYRIVPTTSVAPVKRQLDYRECFRGPLADVCIGR